ncbi:hypothetical protein [Amycolatopsis cihanbeyliensis]|uniref:MYXO-CTERM domain-containing protein n=1 Tax=Amycolatopsis cihanbeyliensis TaxID=1128664 RepID=A0A542CTW5_AMYCI|nr:hypothetical protein [Amycolatopsis cihanbeyliensis]TQI94234.1 hypothetical protein FB471_6392 [Amycolatopsis cihanbeyliensis]
MSPREREPEVRGISELTQRLVTVLWLRHPVLHQVVAVAIGVLVAVCLVASITRLSPLPLLPLPLLGLAGYAQWRVRGATTRKPRLAWTVILLGGIAVGFWLIGVVGRWLG